MVYLAIFVLVIAGIAIAGYHFMDRKPATPVIDLPVSATPPSASTTAARGADIPLPGTTTPDMSDWKVYSNDSAGYSIAYPGNAMISADSGILSVIFPKNAYFHWPLLDNAKVTVSVATSCPALESENLLSDNGASPEFTLNGYDFRRTIADGVAAGNRYREIAYDTTVGGSCYHIYLYDHGANGAGLYVDSAALIKKYDDVHDADFSNLISAFNAMVGTFRILAQKG